MGKFSKPRNPFHEDEDLTQVIPHIADSDETQIIPPVTDSDESQIIPPAADSDLTQIFDPIDDSQQPQNIPPLEEDDLIPSVPAFDNLDDLVPAQTPPSNRPSQIHNQRDSVSHPNASGNNTTPPDNFKDTTSPIDKNKKIMLISICSVALVAIIGIIIGVSLFLGGGKDNGRILNNVTAAGVNIGGMTPEEAKTILHRATDLTYTYEDMVIELPDGTIRLSPKDTGVKLDIDAVVKEAFNYGRTGTKAENAQAHADSMTGNHPIALLPYLNLNLDYIRSTLEQYGTTYNSTFQQSEVKVIGTAPQLNAAEEEFSVDAPCQTLVIKLGVPGRNVDIDKLYNQVLDAYSFNIFHVTAKLSQDETVPDKINLEELHKQYSKEPKDAIMDMQSFDIIQAVYGYGFDLEAAQKQLDEAKYSDVLEIPFKLIAPQVIGDDLKDVLYRDELASYKTAHTNDSNRNTNLKLACKAINGKVLNPGDVFDYNAIVGRRTASAGYKPAGAYVNGELVPSVGGGICQVSSTLYYCALMADLEIVSRTAHSYPASYMPLGMDATVSWGGPEFKFRNNTNYPIRIEAEVSGGYVQIKLIGTDEKDYYVKMEYETTETIKPETITETMSSDNPKGYTDGQVIQEPITGYTVKTYQCKYNKETKKLMSRDHEATSNYKKRDKIVVSILQPTDAPTETPAVTDES